MYNFFRSGLIEAGDIWFLDITYPEHENQIPSIELEETIIKAIRRYLDVQSGLNISLPIFATITLIQIKGFKMSSKYQGRSQGEGIDRAVLPLPEIMIEDYRADVGQLLRTSFDALWQACGLEGSPNYDNEGKWRPHHS